MLNTGLSLLLLSFISEVHTIVGEKGGIRNNWAVLILFFGLLKTSSKFSKLWFFPTGIFLAITQFRTKFAQSRTFFALNTIAQTRTFLIAQSRTFFVQIRTFF